MSARLPSVRGDVVVRTLEKAGFEVVRIKGSHHVMEQLLAQYREIARPLRILAEQVSDPAWEGADAGAVVEWLELHHRVSPGGASRL